jgi:hypothetical protein
VSLNESAERNVGPKKQNEDDTNGTSTKLCSACEKKSDTLMKCRACKCVWYCDKDCQNRHWKEHKKECKPIKKELDKRGGKLDLGNELDLGCPGKLPQREECPICMRALPPLEILSLYMVCCGKTLCYGCELQHQVKSGVTRTCAFCRTKLPKSEGEILERLSKRVESKDPSALRSMAMCYFNGNVGQSVDWAKCIDLLRQSAGLGDIHAQYQLGKFYHFGEAGLEKDQDEALQHYRKAAEGGELKAHHNIGCTECKYGYYAAAMRHWRLSSSAGFRESMDSLIAQFGKGLLHHDDLAKTLQAFYSARAEMKSKGRDQYIVHLKIHGQYEEARHEY